MPEHNTRPASTDATLLDVDTRARIAAESEDIVTASETLYNDDDGSSLDVGTARLMVRTIERALAEVKHLIDACDDVADQAVKS